MSISHRDLVNLWEKLGYEHHTEGLCHGFSWMLAQAILAQDEATFYARLDLIAEYKAEDETFHSLLEELSQAKRKVKQNTELSTREKSLFEILAFYDGISLYQTTYQHKDVFSHNPLGQLQESLVYGLSQPEQLKGTSLATYFEYTNAFNKNRLVEFLNELANIIIQLDTVVPIIISSNSHAVCLSLDKNNSNSASLWAYVDTNMLSFNKKYHLEITSQLLAKCLFISFTTDEDHLPIHFEIPTTNATEQFNTLFCELTERFPIQNKDAKLFDKEDNELLKLACKSNDLIAVNQLIDLGISVNNKKNCLYTAILSSNIELVKLLLEAEALFSQAELHIVYIRLCFSGNLEILNLLIEKGFDINGIDNSGQTLLHLACTLKMSPKFIQALLDNGANINQLDNLKNSPLQLACTMKHLEIAKQLLQNGALVNNENQNVVSALYWAISKNHPEMIHLLLENGASFDHRLLIHASRNPNNKITIDYKTLEIQNLKNSIEQLKYYTLSNDIVDIDDRRRQAFCVANTLTILLNSFIQNTDFHNQKGCQQFIKQCNETIESYKGKEEFKIHRAYYKIIFSNIAIALTGLGALFLLVQLAHSYYSTGKAVGFFEKTKGMQNIEAIESNLNYLASP